MCYSLLQFEYLIQSFIYELSSHMLKRSLFQNAIKAFYWFLFYIFNSVQPFFCYGLAMCYFILNINIQILVTFKIAEQILKIEEKIFFLVSSCLKEYKKKKKRVGKRCNKLFIAFEAMQCIHIYLKAESIRM